MIFESLWPLLFLAAVPIIIILYLLKPKGEDLRISSNLLWKMLLKNEQSKTFFEKFVHNILMYLQLLIIALLVIALMSPFIQKNGTTGGRSILLVDTSASMQHIGENGQTRLQEAIEQACDYVQTMNNTQFSLVTTDACGAELLAVDLTDATQLTKLLKNLKSCDASTNLTGAQNILDSLAAEESTTELVVFTDGAGAGEFEQLHTTGEKQLIVVGTPTTNVSNEYTVFTQREDGLYDIMVSMTNYSAEDVTFDVGLYDEEEKLIALMQKQLAAGESASCLFEGVDWQGETLSSRLSGFSFAQGGRDSLEKDNVSHALRSKGSLIQGLFVGEGNTFLEKAYQAVTGSSIAKTTSDYLAEDGAYNVVIYDAGQIPQAAGGNRLVFGEHGATVTQTLSNVVLDMTDCDLTAGLNGFRIGVNTAYAFEVPEDAVRFLTYEEHCVGYYRQAEGYREVVVGFDIRESDFPLRAEFPVFLANAMIYLSDTSWLATNTYYAGEMLALQPWAEPLEGTLPGVLEDAGIYEIGNEEYQEAYVVRFQTYTESDGQAVAESVRGTGQLQMQKVKQTIRNVFIGIAILVLVLEWFVYVRQMRYKGRFYAVIRGVVFVCVVLALLGLRIPVGSTENATIFMVDLSNSNEDNLPRIKEYISEKVGEMPSGNQFGIVTFGNDTLVEQFLTNDKVYSGLLTMPEKTATNYEEALSKALTLIPPDANGRVVILTDGKETKGDINRMAQVLTATQTELLTVLYEDEITQDAYIEKVNVPTYLHPGDKYSIQVVVESNYDTDAQIEIYNGSKQIATNPVHLNKGSNHFVFSNQVSAQAEGNATENLRIRVVAQGDTCGENDAYSAYSVVEAAPRTLVISSRNSSITAFTEVLNAAGCDYSMVSSLNAPDTIEKMLEYRSIILVDTYIDELPKGFLDHLETYVKDYGCGFVCCGGEDSFALGGYRDTVIETVLPVDMEMLNMNEMPSMAMVMVIDRSGSMTGNMGSGPSNLDLAIKAATVAVDNLRDVDYVGVLTFDGEYEWQVELTQARNRQEIKNKIMSITDGGGTTIKPALQEAYRVISQSDASVKHVVLLTDGMGETTNFDDVIKSYSEGGITLSTVAVGDGSDTKLLERLARGCGGRYYFSDISSDIPKIFAQEVFLGGDSYIQNGEFALSLNGNHELTRNLFVEGWPRIYGYVSASPKTASRSVITSAKKDDPILTVWNYGLGRTVAWNSDVTGEWSGAFSGKEDYVQLWKRIVDYSAGNTQIGEDKVDVVTASGVTQIVYQTPEYSEKTKILATVIDPEGNTQEIELHATVPGKYEAELATSRTGLYRFNVRRMEGDEMQSYLVTAASVQYSDEYKFDISTDSYVSFIEKYGRILQEDEKLWTDLKTKANGSRDLTNWLLGLAICLFLADVAMRRFQYVPKWNLAKKRSTEAIMVQDNAGQQEALRVMNEEETKPVKEKKKSEKASKKKKAKQEEQLDTSQLLKKKDNRNI